MSTSSADSAGTMMLISPCLAKRVPRKVAANTFGVMQVDSKGNVLAFQEKSAYPVPLPDDDTMCIASMGNYAFGSNTIEEASNC